MSTLLRRRTGLWFMLCGGSFGVAIAIISFVARIEYWETPEHPPLVVALFLGLTGFVAGCLVVALLLKLVGFEHNMPRGLVVWLLVGLFYGVFAPIVAGALAPAFAVLRSAAMGQLGLLATLSRLFDSFFFMPHAAIVQGFLGIPAGLWSGVLLAVCGWIIDRLRLSSRHTVATYGPFTVAIGLALITLGVVTLGPASLLSRLGWGPG